MSGWTKPSNGAATSGKSKKKPFPPPLLLLNLKPGSRLLLLTLDPLPQSQKPSLALLLRR